jgi:hypothetical protein
MVEHDISKTYKGNISQFDHYICQYCDDIHVKKWHELCKHNSGLHSSRFGEIMLKYYRKADALTDDTIRAAIVLMSRNLIGEEEFAIFVKPRRKR